jgi:hypothetical protein
MLRILLGIGLILSALWLIGLITSYTFGGALHTLLVAGVILVAISLIFGRK